MKSKTYEEFVEKFKPKKTTDDCYTPPTIYNIVRDWVCAEYGVHPANIVRPFYPGGDYVNFNYPPDAVVVDNPPFSILTQICSFYIEQRIPFFLFAPGLTCFSGRAIFTKMNHIVCDARITYENGAIVATSFVTSFGGDIVAQTEPRLSGLINNEVKRLKKEDKKKLPKYEYPEHIVTAAMMRKYAGLGVDFKVYRGECVQLGALDAQRSVGKAIFGTGLLLSEEAAARKAVAEEAAARKAVAEEAAKKAEAKKYYVWGLSDREREIVAKLSASR